MATSGDIFCGPCDAQHITKPAERWCPECEEGLCPKCQRHHSVSRASRKHKTITIESYKKIPAYILNIEDTCHEHEMKYSMYCPNHDNICCPLCVAVTHAKCTDLKVISELIKNVKSSALISSMLEKLQEMMKIVDNVVTKVTLNQTLLKQQRHTAITEIQQLRCKINAHLDSLEEKMIKEINLANENINAHLEKVKSDMCIEIEEYKILQNNLTNIKEYGSDIQTFYGSRKLQIELENKEKNLQSISTDIGMKEQHIVSTINNQISNILIWNTFGRVTTKTGPSFCEFTTGKDILGQKVSVPQTSPSMYFDDIRIIFKSAMKPPLWEPKRNYIRDFLICPNKKLLLVDENNEALTILSPYGSFEINIMVSNYPRGATLINENTAAVSTNAGIQTIDIISEETKQMVKTKKPCCGIAYNEGSLYWHELAKGISKLHISTGEVTTLIEDTSSFCISYICSYLDKIYFTTPKTVCCSTLLGNVEWEFKFKSHKVGLDTKRVTVDNDSNVYVTSFLDNSLFMISPDGKRSRQLLGETDGLQNPTGVQFDKVQKHLLVSNRDGSIFVFQYT